MKKIHHILSALLTLAVTLGLQSCLKDQADVFDNASSLRLQEYLDKTQKTLVDAPYGWAFDIYPERTQAYGGYAFTLKFDREKCKVRSVLNASREDESYYKMTSEVGPAITFDTYNPLMHYFSNPSSARFQALKGDFEFVIDSVSENLIKVHGYRTKNVMYLRKLDMPAANYINKVDSFSADFTPTGLWSFKGKVNGTDVQGELDASELKLTYNSGQKEETTAIAFTDRGVRTYRPLQIGGTTFGELTFNASDSTYRAKGANNEEIILKAEQPKWFPAYANAAGKYTLEAVYSLNNTDYNVELDVDLKLTADYKGYEMEGALLGYNIRLTFDRKEEAMIVAPQQIGRFPDGNVLMLTTFSTSAGRLTTSPSACFSLKWDNAANAYVFRPKGEWGYPSSGWFLGVYDSQWSFLGNAKALKVPNAYLFGRAYERLDQLLKLKRRQ